MAQHPPGDAYDLYARDAGPVLVAVLAFGVLAGAGIPAWLMPPL